MRLPRSMAKRRRQSLSIARSTMTKYTGQNLNNLIERSNESAPDESGPALAVFYDIVERSRQHSIGKR